jgi:hypothetical protein
MMRHFTLRVYVHHGFTAFKGDLIYSEYFSADEASREPVLAIYPVHVWARSPQHALDHSIEGRKFILDVAYRVLGSYHSCGRSDFG